MPESPHNISSNPSDISQDKSISDILDRSAVPDAVYQEPEVSGDEVLPKTNDITDLQYKHVVAHADRIVVRIPVNRKNAFNLVKYLDDFQVLLAIELIGNNRLEFKRTGKHHDILQYEFNGVFTKVKFRLPKPLNNFYLENNRYPAFKELQRLDYRGSWLALIEIIDRRKRCPAYHVENVLKVIDILDKFFSIECNTLEIALDTRSPESGILLRKCACLLRPPRDNSLFHFDPVPGEKKPKLMCGPSKDGNLEYVGYRPKGWNDNRPNEVRPRGGRRQLVSYDRTVRFGKDLQYTFPRVELRFYRDYIHKYTRENNLSVVQLLLQIEKLVKGHIVLRKLDLNKLQSDRPDANLRELNDRSTKGQIYLLRQHGMTNEDIKQYVTNEEWPMMRYIVDPKNSCEEDISDYNFYFWEDVPV